MTTELVQLDSLASELACAQDAEQLKRLYDKLSVVADVARKLKRELSEQNRIATMRIQTARKAGSVLQRTVRRGGNSRGGSSAPLPEGISWNQSSRWQALARVDDSVIESYVADCEENECEITFAGLLRTARGGRVHFSSATDEWLTPRDVLDRVVSCLDEIELDPCSNARKLGDTELCDGCGERGADRHACSCREVLCPKCFIGEHQNHDTGEYATLTPNVPAREHFTRRDDGLTRNWSARSVFMNPPYGQVLSQWVDKLLEESVSKHVKEAIALVPARTDTKWFRAFEGAQVCFFEGRLRFGDATNSAPFPSAAIYIGRRKRRFMQAFRDAGHIYERVS